MSRTRHEKNQRRPRLKCVSFNKTTTNYTFTTVIRINIVAIKDIYIENMGRRINSRMILLRNWIQNNIRFCMQIYDAYNWINSEKRRTSQQYGSPNCKARMQIRIVDLLAHSHAKSKEKHLDLINR